jgi:putative Ig domain-containing protein
MRNIYLLLLISFFILSCTSGKQTGQGRNTSNTSISADKAEATGSLPIDQYALEISPKTASRDSTLNLTIIGFDVHDARIEWLLNGAVVESDNPTQFRLSEARKGDTLQARAFIRGREIQSNKVEVVNTLPVVANIRILPDVFKPGDSISVAAEGYDADGDNVTLLYEWTVNGKPAGNRESLEGPVTRGDKICLKVTPCDAEGNGRTLVLNRAIQNQPPVINEHREFNFDGTTYTYQVKASDPDGDALLYSLEGAPEGMYIDTSTGLITWKVPAEFKGNADAIAVVNDGNGGIARYNLKISIK